MDLGLGGRVYLVTAATRGLGFATARELVADGAKVVVTGRTKESLADAVEALGGAEVAEGVVADNGDPDTATRLIGAALERFGRLDGVLISVGGPAAGSVLTSPESAWRDAFESVFLGALRIARAAADVLGDGGAIGFVLSASVREPIPGLAVSNGLRPGLAMAAKTLATELGPEGIRVFGLLPARIETERVAHLDNLAADPAAARAHAEAGIPLRRYGRPEEFGKVAAFALSPAASYLTGVMIPVDGGALHGI
ncbi:SDR family oxidoreductase [Streptacidiphilus fuscans]|uniref:SDR family oxidoreductase n=1 Tax=Streptacidiphilus fuscans TaxID=2789292 RepID=A0A931FE37_9ACTN|nr:SDR family oxidoreductase [Streptacidiphilus fuscans]MBF9071342.1 SDR family oxidoreductase [Streptacidiphilus fuscans]